MEPRPGGRGESRGDVVVTRKVISASGTSSLGRNGMAGMPSAPILGGGFVVMEPLRAWHPGISSTTYKKDFLGGPVQENSDGDSSLRALIPFGVPQY